MAVLFVAAMYVMHDAQAGQTSVCDRVADHVLVKFNPEHLKTEFGAKRTYDYSLIINRLGLPAGGRLEETAFARWARGNSIRNKQSQTSSDPGADFSHFMYLKLPKGLTPEQCVSQLKGSPLIEYVEVDQIGTGGATPNDPQYPMQWHLAGSNGYPGRIHAPEAWDITTGTSDVVVAVLDTGCDTNNLEFAGRTVPGWDFVNGDSDPADDNGHGTAVAAILCASANNWSYGAGIDWNCRLMPVKVLDANNTGAVSYWAQGIDWAVSNGAKIINLSAGTLGWNNSLHIAITNAVGHGVIFVTITHNYPGLGILYPGSDPASITVGGVDTNGTRCSFSAYGTNIDLVAPATNMYTVTTGDVWETWSGTSFAAPQVAGVASLICSLRPDLNNEQVRNLLCAGADDRVSSDTNDVPGFDNYYGWGLLNAQNSLILAGTSFEPMSRSENGDMVLSWPCPPNASNKLPYRIEFTSDLQAGDWLSASNIVYVGTQASWIDNSTNATNRFYRIRIRAF
jgi:subtilisin family serine protease